MQNIHIMIIVGSLRKHSYNMQLAQAAKSLVGEHVQMDILDYHDIPYMNEDIEFPTPNCIQSIRNQIAAADGIWIFSPEYNHAYPGVLKNLLDWLSRPDALGNRVLNRKPTALSGITPGMSGTGVAQDMLVTLCSFLNMNLMNMPRLTIPNALTQVEGNTLVLKESLPYLQAQYDAFIAFIKAQTSKRE